MTGMAAQKADSRWSNIATYGLGGLIGGAAGGVFVVVVILALKSMMSFVSTEVTWLLVLVPLIGLALTVIVLQVVGQDDAVQAHEAAPPRNNARPASRWRTFPRNAIQADISGDVINSAGEEERFPWQLTPLRTLAIFTTVGFGVAMGTEAPAAYFGAAAGAFLGDRGRRWRRFLRPAALGGGAAGVAALYRGHRSDSH